MVWDSVVALGPGVFGELAGCADGQVEAGVLDD